jgi:glutathione S-transferase
MTASGSPVIYLHMPAGRPWGMPNLSPFCTKLETYLRMAGWAYEFRPADFRRAPKGKIPYVTIDGELLGDSQLIIEELERRRGNTLDAHLTEMQRATGHVVRRTLEEALYFILAYHRWADDSAWQVYRPVIGQGMPAPVRLALPLIRRGIRKSLRSQGTARHSAAEIAAMGVADLAALEVLLGEQEFLFGSRPSTCDASAFASIEGIAAFPHDSELRRYLLRSANLMRYRDRIRARWFADLSPEILT